MSQAEFAQWVQYYKLYPFDDFHRIYKPIAILSAVHGADANEVIERLAPDPAFDGVSEVDASIFRTLGIKPKGE